MKKSYNSPCQLFTHIEHSLWSHWIDWGNNQKQAFSSFNPSISFSLFLPNEKKEVIQKKDEDEKTDRKR